MSKEGYQSAYSYRHSRYKGRYESSSSPVQSEKSEFSKSPTSQKPETEKPPRIDTAKLTADPFLGTVAGRLAQEIHDEFLVCKICFDSYNNPKCLACLHTFCAACIEKHISAEVTYNKYTDYRDFTCPLCRKRTQLPLGGVKKLPDNFLISGLTELVLRQRASSQGSSTTTLIGSVSTRGPGDGLEARLASIGLDESRDSLHQLPNFDRRALLYGECEICAQVGRTSRGHSTEPVGKSSHPDTIQRASSANLSSSPQATSKCLDCNKLLCAECVQRHRNTKVTKDHATFDLQSDSDIECKEHPGEVVRFYCEACSICICVLCTFNAHREHEVTSFGEAVNKLRNELNSSLEDACQRIENSQTFLHSVGEAVSLVHNIETSIHETAEQFIEEIQRQERELISALHHYVGEANMHLIEKHPEHEHNVEEAETIFKEIQKCLQGQDMELLLAKAKLKSRVGEMNDLRLLSSDMDTISNEIYFRSGTVQLGYLTNDAPEETEQSYHDLSAPISSSSSSVELANRPCINSTACQTDLNMIDNNSTDSDNQMVEKTATRSRACNTDMMPTLDKETNTRPRGIHTVITFSDASKDASEEFLSKVDNSNNNNVDLESLDSLTRARVRRKLHERYHTFDQTPNLSATIFNTNQTMPSNGNSDFVTRRYSAYDRRLHH